MSERYVPARLRRRVAENARHLCEYCRSQLAFSSQPFAIEHIFPLARGGKTVFDNLAFACQGCNGLKTTHTEGRDPVTREDVGLFHPRRQKWSEHFAWSDDFMFIVGRTPTGRATVEELELNREGCINLRRALYAVGEHPPDETV